MTDAHTAVILAEGDPEDAKLLSQLRARPDIEFIDHVARQRTALHRLTPEPAHAILTEPFRWVYYPWRRAVMAMLGPRGFRRLRLDRNRNLITDDEQQRLLGLRIGVIGLSVGHVIAHTLAAQGLAGELRLADFDELEAANLNRVPATVFDEGHNKAHIAARRIAELDPYLTVHAETTAITTESIDAFLDGLDIVVEECDSLDTKVLVRQAARARGLPVLMTTSDRGLIDVERFDIDPQRPILHGLLGDIDIAELAGLSSADKVPYVLGLLDAGALSARMAASLCEVGETLSTWPQLAGEVTLGASLVAEAVRRIGLREPLPSGRVRVDVSGAMDTIVDPLADRPVTETETETETDAYRPSASVPEVMAHAANLGPSGGNTQPWRIDPDNAGVTLRIDPARTSLMDVEFRGSAVALGAAAFNARIAAAAGGHGTRVTVGPGTPSPLQIRLDLAGDADPALAALYGPMMDRETNRHPGVAGPITGALAEALHTAATRGGARLTLVTDRDELAACASILAAADRIRYLTTQLHGEMFAELWWPGDPSPEYGIDVRSLELPPSDFAVLDVLRRPEVMEQLARWDAGAVLGSDARDRVSAASAVAVISVSGHTLADYAEAGAAVEAVWITAQLHGLAVQPVSPAFLYAHDVHELSKMAPRYPEQLQRLQYSLRTLTGTSPDEAQALVLRLTEAPRPSLRSRRRPLQSAASPPG